MCKFNSILLIDDDVVNNYINISLFKKLNMYNFIQICKNGQEGIDYIQSLDLGDKPYPDVIFLDIHMPIMDGYEFMNILTSLRLRHQLKIVILSTSIRTQDEINFENLGADFFIQKPLTEHKIIELIRNIYYLKNA